MSSVTQTAWTAPEHHLPETQTSHHPATSAPAVATWPRTARLVDEQIVDIITSAIDGTNSVQARGLWRHLADSFEGGKRLRPQLVWTSYAAFGGTDEVRCSALGAAFELLHAALVIHDDVIDQDLTRRGRSNIAGIYGRGALERGLPEEEARHVGRSVAIVAGDMLLAAAFRAVREINCPEPARQAIADLMDRAVADAAGGELEDILIAQDTSISLGDVLEMERQKTAVYSFAAPLAAGALLAGAPAASAAALELLGEKVGIAYQVIDDVLGTFGDPGQTGKSVTSDLRGGKMTALTALGKRDPQVSSRLHAAADSDDAVEALKAALHHAGADDSALALAHELVSEALQDAADAGLPAPLRTDLTRICNHVLHREN